MKQAERNWDSDEEGLFQAGRAEAPAAGSADGVLAALGLEIPMGPGPGGEAAPQSGLSPAGSQAAPAAPTRSGIFSRPATWVVGGGAILAIIPAAILLSGSGPTDAPAFEVVEEPAAVAASADDARATTAATSAVEETSADEILPSQAAPVAVAPSAPRAAIASSDKDARPSLAEELLVIKQARSRLNAGNLSGARASLKTHQEKFSPPRLASEARVIRVEILVKQGQMAQARAMAKPLMTKNSPYRARMETLLSSP